MEAQLRTRHREALEYLASLESQFAAILESRSDGAADDEHDPEGPTMSQEWSQTSALIDAARVEVESAEHALERLAAGTYGICRDCGEPIAPARLEARPLAEQCVSCAERAGR